MNRTTALLLAAGVIIGAVATPIVLRLPGTLLAVAAAGVARESAQATHLYSPAQLLAGIRI